jgi:AcrB/AcrD/AcrF family protein
VAEYQKQLSPGNRIEVTGQIDSMNAAFRDLAIGILFAAVFVYLLMVVNYQTWSDPFVVILALPATFCGIVTMLYVTETTLSVPSLMGAIMAIGVASANSILLVTFARERQLEGSSAFDAAIAAGRTRIRPVLMTAAAMVVGMIPMAIGGAGEEQNAALARAVIGGLLFATPTTLLVVPYLFALLRTRNDGKPAHGGVCGGPAMNDVQKPLTIDVGAESCEKPCGRKPGGSVTEPGRPATKATGLGGGRILALGALVLLCGALGIGFWQHYGFDAAADIDLPARNISASPRRDFVPSVRTAPVRASPSTMAVTWPGTTEAFETTSPPPVEWPT